MTETPKITIISPVYNAEKFVDKFIQSIQHQSFTDFELLLVNDGSTDHSGDICDKYASHDKRIKVFHKENGGVSSARQMGLDKSSGEYIIHADPDDWIEPEMLQELYQEAKKENSDMVICDFYINAKDSQTVSKQDPIQLDSKNVLRSLFHNLHGSCCNKLVKHSCINKYNAQFPLELSLCEDLYFNVTLLKNDLKVNYLPKAFYHYIKNENANSLTDANRSSFEYDQKLITLFSQLLKNNDCLKDCINKFSFDLLTRAYGRKQFSSKEFKKKCKQYKQVLSEKEGLPFSYKFKLYMSCIGFYRLMLKLDKIKTIIIK